MHCFILISRDTARQRNLKFYFTGSVCARGNVWVRRTSTANCVCPDCAAVKNKGNNQHYHSVKNDPEFKEKIRRATRERKEWKREYDREYRERTRDKQREWSRNWAEKNKEKRLAISHNHKAKRRRQESGGISTSDLAEWISDQKKVCYWCGSDCKDKFHVDHYVPLSKEGKHEAENLVIACPTCNLRKSAKDPYDFAQEVGRLF